MSNNIDKIIYINLNKRSDRKVLIEGELNNFILPYERFEAIENSDFGCLGCGYSHLAVLKMAKDKGYKNILILEDDFMFVVTKEEFEKELSDFFNLYPDFDVCMLSYNLNKFEPTKYDNILRVLDAQTTAGYIVNNKYYDALINLYEEAMPLLKSTQMHWIYANDQIWKQLQPKDNWYCFSNRIGKQRPGYSDIANSYVEYDC
jgi:GR25 family glycosyltransferase involved in LPS biosynthesis